MQLTHPRIVHAEFMTHCAFARNASSSRAIPFAKMVTAILDDPFIPVWWGKNQAGMQSREEINEIEKGRCLWIWLEARNSSVKAAAALSEIGLHKQICNRLLEPWGWITVCVTGDAGAWSNYFALRCHPDAQPEIQKQAYMARDLYFNNSPRALGVGEWHLPYISEEEKTSLELPIRVSVGRCARTSYLTQEGKRDPAKDIELYNRLYEAKPMHASPFEHAAVATGDGQRYGKYTGWKSHRHMIPGEYTTDFQVPK
jgi:hypothetical protein